MRLGRHRRARRSPWGSVRFAGRGRLARGRAAAPPELFAAAEVGVTLGCDDGGLALPVRACGEGWLEAERWVAGVLRPRKG